MSPQELANSIYNKKVINRYSPLTMANWLENFSKNAKKYIPKSQKNFKRKKPFIKKAISRYCYPGINWSIFCRKISFSMFLGVLFIKWQTAK